MDHGAGAHGTGLQGDVENAAGEPVVAGAGGGVAQGLDLGVGSRVVAADGPVPALADDLTAAHHHRATGTSPSARRASSRARAMNVSCTILSSGILTPRWQSSQAAPAPSGADEYSADPGNSREAIIRHPFLRFLNRRHPQTATCLPDRATVQPVSARLLHHAARPESGCGRTRFPLPVRTFYTHPSRIKIFSLFSISY